MAIQSLYRKYRPSIFNEIVGQDHIVKTLLNEIISGRISHAYLFCGPRGVGKTTMARLIAKAVNCENPINGEPCNKCQSCKNIINNRALDIIEIDAASHTGVDNVRDNIINNARVAASGIKCKIFIIDEVHMLSASAFNALLKVLEEPPAKVIFILATTEIHKVPDTIISRCQRFDFQKVALKKIVEKLERIILAEKIQVDLEVLKKIARNSEGSARDAESLLGQILSLDEKHITAQTAELVLPRNDTVLLMDFFKAIATKQTKAAFEQIDKMSGQGIDFEEFNKNFLEFLRQVLLFSATGKLSELEYLDVNKNAHEEIIDILKNITTIDLSKIIRNFLEKTEIIKNADIKQLPLELAVIELCEKETENKPFFKKKIDLNLAVPDFQKKESPQENLFIASDGETLKLIKAEWVNIISDLKKINYSLAMLLGMAAIVDYDTNNTLHIGLTHQFHNKLVCDKKNSKIITEAIEKYAQKKVKISCLIDKKYAPDISLTNLEKSDSLQPVPESEAANVWDLALNTFTNAEIKE